MMNNFFSQNSQNSCSNTIPAGRFFGREITNMPSQQMGDYPFSSKFNNISNNNNNNNNNNGVNKLKIQLLDESTRMNMEDEISPYISSQHQYQGGSSSNNFSCGSSSNCNSIQQQQHLNSLQMQQHQALQNGANFNQIFNTFYSKNNSNNNNPNMNKSQTFSHYHQQIQQESQKLQQISAIQNQCDNIQKYLKEGMYESDKNWENPVQYYAKDIFHYLNKNEQLFLSDCDYMKNMQTDINEKMRAILVDWLVEVHLKFKLVPETLYMTVNIIDRYLSKNAIQRQKLQLVGVSAMFIASKFEEIYAPEVKDFVFVCDKAYTKEEILHMESLILKQLNFDLTSTSAYRFSQRLVFLSEADKKIEYLTQYLLELSLVEYKMLKYSPSLLGASAVYIAHHIQKKKGWNQVLESQSEFSEEDLQSCGMDLFILFSNAQKLGEKQNAEKDKNVLEAVKRKFSLTKFLEVAKISLQLTVSQNSQQ